MTDPFDSDPGAQVMEDAAEVLHAVRPTPAKHIALFIYALTGGGAQRRTVTIANAFAACGHSVDLVVVTAEGVLNDDLAPGVRLVDLRKGCGRLHARAADLARQRGIRTALAVPSLARYLRLVRPDVLLSAASHVNLVAVSAMRLARVPIPLVLRVSNHPSGNLAHWPPLQRAVRAWLAWMSRHFYPRADALIAVSAGVAKEIVRLSATPAERVTVIYNPVVDTALRRRLEAPLEHPWLEPGAPPVILGAGRLAVQKDFFTLVEAFAAVRRDHRARLVILGEGPERGALEARAAQLGLAVGEDVLFAGYVANPLPWMRRARLFVLSSRWEGLPGVLIEALAAGCPVVSTDCPSGPAEILGSGRWGTLVPVGDAAAMARAIGAELDAKPDRARLQARAADFAPGPAIGAYLELLDRVICRRSRERLAWSAPWPLSVPLACSTMEGLERALGRVCAGRGDLFRPFAGNAPHRLRLARMMERFEVDPDRAATASWPAMQAADSNCAGCSSTRLCEAWLDADNGEPPAFCPNAELLSGLQRAARRTSTQTAALQPQRHEALRT